LIPPSKADKYEYEKPAEEEEEQRLGDSEMDFRKTGDFDGANPNGAINPSSNIE
jgi:hypothetical protein